MQTMCKIFHTNVNFCTKTLLGSFLKIIMLLIFIIDGSPNFLYVKLLKIELSDRALDLFESIEAKQLEFQKDI